MSADIADRIERAVDAGAAALFAIAAGLCGLRLSVGLVGSPAVAVLAFACALDLLRSVRPEPRRYALVDFDLVEVAPAVEDLLLTDSDRLPAPQPRQESDELLLDDVLAELAPDSRVVRLFDRSAMPTPGELRARIDRHLDAARRQAAAPDASQALHEALDDLRRSLR